MAKVPLSENTVTQTVAQIVAEVMQVNVEQITPQMNWAEELGADSNDHLEIVIEVEQAYDREIPDGKVNDMTTVEAVVNFILGR